ncbi:MAG: winged helix-turn-helix transcriptional regulator [Nitrososphaera sp.]
MNWQTFFDTSDIKILFYLHIHHEARYSELERSVVKTRSVLSVSLRDLSKRKLIDRMVETTKPIQTRYKLTDKGTKLVQQLFNVQKLVL